MSLRSRAQRIARDCAEYVAILQTFDEAAVYDLLRRAQFSTLPDGFSPSTRPSEIHGQGDDDPLLTIAVARMEHNVADPLRDHIEEIFGSLSEIGGHTKRMARLRSVVIHAGDKLKGRPSQLSVCQACRRDVANTPTDRLRAGYCDACRTAWDRAGRPDRLPWEIKRRAEADAARDIVAEEIEKLQQSKDLPSPRAG